MGAAGCMPYAADAEAYVPQSSRSEDAERLRGSSGAVKGRAPRPVERSAAPVQTQAYYMKAPEAGHPSARLADSSIWLGRLGDRPGADKVQAFAKRTEASK